MSSVTWTDRQMALLVGPLFTGSRIVIVLTREAGQSFVIPVVKVVIIVLVIGRGRVKIGIDADRTIEVWRSELIAEKYVELAAHVRSLIGRLFGHPALT